MIVVTSFLLESDEKVELGQLHRLMKQLKDSLKSITRGRVSLVPSGALSAFYLDDASNLGRCERCHQLTSERSRPEFVGGLAEGYMSDDGKFRCVECEMRCSE